MSDRDRAGLFLHLVLDAVDAAAAGAEARAVVAALSRMGRVQPGEVQRYAKFTGTWSLRVDIWPVGSTPAAFGSVVAQAPLGWTHGESGPGEDLWAVWNRAGEEVLLVPSVRWADLEARIQP